MPEIRRRRAETRRALRACREVAQLSLGNSGGTLSSKLSPNSALNRSVMQSPRHRLLPISISPVKAGLGGASARSS